MTAYASVISAKTPTAPAMHSAHVAGRSGFGRRMRTKTITSPIKNNPTDQISRPAGCIHGNQSGITLGIGPVVLREASGWARGAVGFLSRYLSVVQIVGSWRRLFVAGFARGRSASVGPRGVRRATMHG